MYLSKSFLRINVLKFFKSNLQKIENLTKSNQNEINSFNVKKFLISKNAKTKWNSYCSKNLIRHCQTE